MNFLRHDLPRILVRVVLAWLCVLAWGNPFLHRDVESTTPQREAQPTHRLPQKIEKKNVQPTLPQRPAETELRDALPDSPKMA